MPDADIRLSVDLTDLWSWPDIPRFQKQSVFDLSGRRFNAAAALGIKDAVLIPNPAGAFSVVRGLVNPGKGWGLRGAWGGQPIQGSTLVTLPTASPAVSAGVAKRINSAVAAMSPTAFCGLTSPSPSTNEPRLLTCDSCTDVATMPVVMMIDFECKGTRVMPRASGRRSKSSASFPEIRPPSD
jgi:hypothetical protein